MKTSELTGAALDWAVAKCEGISWASYLKDGYSNDWAQGGEIIEREKMALEYFGEDNDWVATIVRGDEAVEIIGAEGETPLEAAMRCYVASKLGDEVDVPKEFIK